MSDTEQMPEKPNIALEERLREAAREADVRSALLRLGVGRPQIEQLIEHYSLGAIERQLAWLPYRKARKASSMIVSAITHAYDKPAALEPPNNSNSSSSESLPEQKSIGLDASR